MIGQIVCSAAGRDRGEYMVIIGFSGEYPLVCNGKGRKLLKPKPKNPKHLLFTNAFIESDRLNSNSSIRKAIKEYAKGNPTNMEEIKCQNQI